MNCYKKQPQNILFVSSFCLKVALYTSIIIFIMTYESANAAFLSPWDQKLIAKKLDGTIFGPTNKNSTYYEIGEGYSTTSSPSYSTVEIRYAIEFNISSIAMGSTISLDVTKRGTVGGFCWGVACAPVPSFNIYGYTGD